MPVYQSSDRPPKFRSKIKYFRKTKVRLGGNLCLILNREWDKHDKEWIYTVHLLGEL